MNFEDILDQAMPMLRRRRRVTYSTLRGVAAPVQVYHGVQSRLEAVAPTSRPELHPPWTMAAHLLLAFEWGSQRHYVESVRDHSGERSDPLYVDVLKYHWIEENQHTKIGPLEIAQLARTMSPDELSTAFDHVQGIGDLVDAVFVGQADQELATFQTVTGRILAEPEVTALRDALHQSMRTIWAEVSLTHPSFKRVALELSREGAAKLGIV